MRKLIFIDNDLEERAKEQCRSIQRKLSAFCDIPRDLLEKMEIVHSIYHMDKGELAKLIFSPNQCICSFSMYTWNHYGSLYQLTEMLERAGELGLKDLMYVDCSGNMIDALNKELPEMFAKDRKKILSAFKDNYIIAYVVDDDNSDNTSFKRVQVLKKTEDYNYFQTTPVNVLELISQ